MNHPTMLSQFLVPSSITNMKFLVKTNTNSKFLESRFPRQSDTESGIHLFSLSPDCCWLSLCLRVCGPLFLWPRRPSQRSCGPRFASSLEPPRLRSQTKLNSPQLMSRLLPLPGLIITTLEAPLSTPPGFTPPMPLTPWPPPLFTAAYAAAPAAYAAVPAVPAAVPAHYGLVAHPNGGDHNHHL